MEEKTQQPADVQLTDKEKSLAAFNNPADATKEFKLGGRTFKVIYLEYDSYLEFLSLLQPLFDTIARAVTGRPAAGATLPGLNLPTGAFSLHDILRYCARDLPQMVAIICNQEALRADLPEQKVDAVWVKKHAKSPIELAQIAALQIAQNKFITEISDFFVQFLPLFRQVTNITAKSTTAETH